MAGLFMQAATAAQTRNCSSDVIPHPSIAEAQILELSAIPVLNYRQDEDSAINFCNVTVTYTHPERKDAIHVTIWLPLEDWNHRLQGSGGSGYAARSEDAVLAAAVAQKYTALATDGGHEVNGFSSESWSLDKAGNLNMALLEDFAYIALNDAAIIGKQVASSFYGQALRFSYWNGCSTGGRQGLMLAQRYPTAYNGILAAAPGVNWPSFVVSQFWPQFVMNQLRTWPAPCVTDAITAAAITECDGIDGVLDGVISLPDLCDFDPHSLVNTVVDCEGENVTITENDALVVQSTWEGPVASNGSFLWYGLEKGTPLSMEESSLVYTKCSGLNCTGAPFPISADWISRFVLRNPSANLADLDHETFDEIFARSKQDFDAIMGTNNPDLSSFKRAGGKIITWHGLSDQLIPPKGTEQYYKEVQKKDPSVSDFYRLFKAPGVHHCEGGDGPVPIDPLARVVDWVERGIVPNTLDAVSASGLRRKLCPYPLSPVYKSGDINGAEGYECEETCE
ncbi:Tannase/feruloyl esterase [Aspergillus pseudotamarii]|uniref:Carboxylic ester hydrolase n=1 Tax=Aspergillus pseudotamarii TaxID=132259 RepID=A0A5N6SIK5_ASPPS|nr:Tannase/feruloyl esterase [Aspergillus pseudotamarii]KAE8133580.1 Tannase/feruloyl esterase [Aspergillus pseudotamarii]